MNDICHKQPTTFEESHNEYQLLIHTALIDEAWPVIHHLKLVQRETRPFKCFRSARVTLVVSGVGARNTRDALKHLFSQAPISAALNIGMAAASDARILPGTPIQVSRLICVPPRTDPPAIHPLPFGLNTLPLMTVPTPLTQWAEGETRLADMEGDTFFELCQHHLPQTRMVAVKIVSDHGSDQILSRHRIQQLIGDQLDKWLPRAITALNRSSAPRLSHSTPQHPPLSGMITRKSVWTATQNNTTFKTLPWEDQQAIEHAANRYRLSFSQLKQLTDMAADMRMWQERPVAERLQRPFTDGKHLFQTLKDNWETLRRDTCSYRNFDGYPAPRLWRRPPADRHGTPIGFGRCPVASPDTRCCNLTTLDTVEGCAFDCSYCAIKTFYDPDRITMDRDVASRLDALELDPQKAYHIGTGQSSDSLETGNRHGVLDALIRLARRYPRIILEMKSKSDNISYFKNISLPPNIIFTWSLNTPTIVKAEEHGTASLSQRLNAAQIMAENGALIGFHFHPIVDYIGSDTEYARLYQTIIERFSPENVVMISFGTLTYSRVVLKQLRRIPMVSKALQMPMDEIAGKFSYPLDIKQRMFQHAYHHFSPWHDRVFFYLCMEDATLWTRVFGYDYPNNEAFERAMITHYLHRIQHHPNGYSTAPSTTGDIP